MSVRERNGSFQADFSHQGKRYRRDFTSKQEAEHWEFDSRARLLRNEEPDMGVKAGEGRSCNTLEDLLRATHERHWKGSRAEDTAVSNAEDVINILGRSKSPAAITSKDIDRMIETFKDRGISGATINRKLAAASKMFSHAYSRDWITKKPSFERLKESDGRLRWLTETEEKLVVRWFKDRGFIDMADLVVVLVDTGMRLGEALRLDFKDTGDGYIRIWGVGSKNGKSRSVPTTQRVREIVRKRLTEKKQGSVFAGLKVRAADHYWQTMREDIGLEEDPQFVIHALRHTFCSRLVQRGANLVEVKELAGHKCIQMTMRYTKIHQENLRSAISRLEPAPSETQNAKNPENGHAVTPCDDVPQVPTCVPDDRFVN